MKAATKLKTAMSELNITQAELAERLNQSRANVSRKLKTDNFQIYDYAEIVSALGCEFEFNIILPNGDKI